MASISSKQPIEAQAFLARLRSANFPDSPTAAPHKDVAAALAPCLEVSESHGASEKHKADLCTWYRENANVVLSGLKTEVTRPSLILTSAS